MDSDEEFLVQLDHAVRDAHRTIAALHQAGLDDLGYASGRYRETHTNRATDVSIADEEEAGRPQWPPRDGRGNPDSQSAWQ